MTMADYLAFCDLLTEGAQDGAARGGAPGVREATQQDIDRLLS